MSDTTLFDELHQMLEAQDRFFELFHQVNRILPENQLVTSVPPETKAGDALKLMQEHGFSQLPVVAGGSVLGIFSYRSFALQLANSSDSGKDVTSLRVEEFLDYEDPEYVDLGDEFREIISILDRKDSVIVSGRHNLLGILTPMDVLRYLDSVANSFVLVQEIELTIRALIREALPNDETFSACVAVALSSKYEAKALPERLEDMTFDDYVWLIRDTRNKDYFEHVFGQIQRTRGKLEEIRDLRNDVFHFRRELSADDHQRLSNYRNWLSRCVMKISSRKEGVR